MNDEMEISEQLAKAKTKAAEAYSVWQAALRINTLGKSDEEATAAHYNRILTRAEYTRCHAEALRVLCIYRCQIL